jgi:hypothetical protein
MARSARTAVTPAARRLHLLSTSCTAACCITTYRALLPAHFKFTVNAWVRCYSRCHAYLRRRSLQHGGGGYLPHWWRRKHALCCITPATPLQHACRAAAAPLPPHLPSLTPLACWRVAATRRHAVTLVIHLSPVRAFLTAAVRGSPVSWRAAALRALSPRYQLQQVFVILSTILSLHLHGDIANMQIRLREEPY